MLYKEVHRIAHNLFSLLRRLPAEHSDRVRDYDTWQFISVKVRVPWVPVCFSTIASHLIILCLLLRE